MCNVDKHLMIIEFFKPATLILLQFPFLMSPASAPPLAALFGTLLVGMMMEKLGRKKTITFLSIPFVVGWLIIGFAVNFTMILVGRLVTGLAFGMARACAPIYVRKTIIPSTRIYVQRHLLICAVVNKMLFNKSNNFRSAKLHGHNIVESWAIFLPSCQRWGY